MKGKNKKIIGIIIDLYGYSTGIATAIGMIVILNRIRKYGTSNVWHSTGDLILWIEILAVGGSVLFFVYKFFKSMVNREKSLK